MRLDARITKTSAIHLGKERTKAIIADPKTDAGRKFRLGMGLNGGAVEELVEILFSMGLRVTVDKNSPDHQKWIASGAVALEKDS